MKTWQDLEAVGEDKLIRADFVRQIINEFKCSDIYREAVIAYDYAKHRNTTINQYQKLLYTMSGKAVPDNYTANWKMASNFFYRFITQETQYLLGNGANWLEESTKEALGKDFDVQLQRLAKDALIGGCAFGFWNLDHLEVFDIREFVPIYDEENGALMAGIRHWQLAPSKPLRATLYEPDGYTEYIWKESKAEILKEKRPYIIKTITTKADGRRFTTSITIRLSRSFRCGAIRTGSLSSSVCENRLTAMT